MIEQKVAIEVRKHCAGVDGLAGLFIEAADTERRLPGAIDLRAKTGWVDTVPDVGLAYGYDRTEVRLGPANARAVRNYDWALQITLALDAEIYARYRKARIDQAESLRDYLIELTQRPLPADKQMANAEVQRRKLEADVINRTIGAAQAKGLRDKQEDQVEKPTTLTIRWGDDGAAEVTTEDNNGLGKASVSQRSAREPLH